MFGLFDVPCANLAGDGVEGNLYYSEVQCGDGFPHPVTNSSILLVNNYSDCILQKIALAQQAGYDCLLSYEEDDSNSSIPRSVSETGFPVAVITSKVANKIIASVQASNGSYTNYTVTITGSIVIGIIIVSICSCFSCTLICTLICSCICCCICVKRNRARNRYREVPEYATRPAPRRQRGDAEIVESILRHLQEMEENHTALGADRAKSIPETRYLKAWNGEETCAICVDDFVKGVRIKTLPCDHKFHSKCIDEWLSNYSSLCPLCKLDLRSAGNLGIRLVTPSRNNLSETTPLIQ